MLSMKIKEHRPIIMQYAKASGIMLLDKYLPELNPWKNLEIIQDIEDWKNVNKNYPERFMCRTDNRLGDKTVRVRGLSGKKEDIASTIEEIKKQSENAVILIMENKFPNIPRHRMNGGFTVAVNLYENIIMELVGKGFDSSEITREKAVHERYVIPWSEVLFIKNKKDLLKNSIIDKYIVSDEDYKKSRQDRITVLENFHEDVEEIKESLPENYINISETTIESLLKNIVFPLYCKTRRVVSRWIEKFQGARKYR